MGYPKKKLNIMIDFNEVTGENTHECDLNWAQICTIESSKPST